MYYDITNPDASYYWLHELLQMQSGEFIEEYIRSKISRIYWLFEPKCRNNAEVTYTQRLQITFYSP